MRCGSAPNFFPSHQKTLYETLQVAHTQQLEENFTLPTIYMCPILLHTLMASGPVRATIRRTPLAIASSVTSAKDMMCPERRRCLGKGQGERTGGVNWWVELTLSVFQQPNHGLIARASFSLTFTLPSLPLSVLRSSTQLDRAVYGPRSSWICS